MPFEPHDGLLSFKIAIVQSYFFASRSAKIGAEEKFCRDVLAFRVHDRLVRHMDLGGRPRGRKSARLFRADRMELCLPSIFFIKSSTS